MVIYARVWKAFENEVAVLIEKIRKISLKSDVLQKNGRAAASLPIFRSGKGLSTEKFYITSR